MNIREILIAAKALIPDEAHWWRGPGSPSEERQCECPLTAIRKLCEDESIETEAEVNKLFRGAIDVNWADDVIIWNDAPERTLTELHAAFDRAIELAGGQ